MATRTARRASLVLDRYAVHGEIASGGMATVHLGQVLGAAGFARTVAIKRLHPQFVKDPEFSAMFLDEARLAARVRHPNVVPTIDVVATEAELFLVMEYVPGESLAGLLHTSRTAGALVPPACAVRILVDVLSGLHAAHEARDKDNNPLEIVHRDVSPHNILVGEDGITRVLDFGIARARVRSHATREGEIKGKLRYLAPEQLRGATATRCADVYSASVVLWETLTGERLFDGDSDGAVYGRVLEGVVPSPSSVVSLPPDLDAVVLRGLARNPLARFATALEMARALEAALAPATVTEVSAWLRKMVGPVLEKRSWGVRAIESGGIPSGRLLEGGEDEVLEQAAPTVGPPTQDLDEQWNRLSLAGSSAAFAPLSTSTLTMPLRQHAASPLGTAIRALGLVGVILGVAVGVVAIKSTSSPPAISASRGIADIARFLAMRVPLAAAPQASAVPVAVVAPVATMSRAVPRKASLQSTRRAPQSACDPPTYVDPRGIHRVKRECL